ncbi:LysR family transcriptional regulator [Paenibacillus rigui]|uniref:HTH lysR-type domain-containing protein n=1 Tax=Paenibacillus rigui TaxID=554312 RepID=A0A229UN28_9BACL|nr:LysR family transcriptional regulator [Paenibacillus rigui]OXM84299.1 hypothetical protein CF651_21180 [Paenibacillus rigui]
MRIEQLYYLVEVAQTGSISLAAEKLHVSQPNISYAISSLEEEIGVTLFTRTRAGTQPTEVGKTIISKAQDIIMRLEDLKDTAKVHSSLLNEQLTVGAISGICTSFLPKMLSGYKNKYPYVEVEIMEGNSGEIEEGVQQGQLDLGLVGIPGEHQFKHLMAEKFMTCKIMACVGANSPLASKESLSLYEIVKHPVIGTSEHMRKELRKYGTPREVFHSSRTEASKHVIAEGMATSFYLDIAMKSDPYVLTGLIIPIPIKEGITVDLYWLHGKKMQSAACAAFLKELMLQVNHVKRLIAL